MLELLSYSPTDVFPVTPEVYARLFVRLNSAVWPAHALTLGLGVAAVWLAWRRHPRPVAAILGAAWISVGLVFHLDLYANLNWAAVHFGWAFIAQGVILLAGGVLSGATAPGRGGKLVSLVVAVSGLIGYPLCAPMLGGAWTGIEVFGIAPEPTVIVTLGLVPLALRSQWLLLIVPVLWSLVAAATAWAMAMPSHWITPAAAAIVMGAALWRGTVERRHRLGHARDRHACERTTITFL